MSKPRLARNAMASVIQTGVSGLSLLVMYRLMMQYLTIEQIGLWSLVIGSTTVARLSEFGIGAGVLRFIAGDLAGDDRAKAARTIGMAFVLMVALVSAVTMLLRPYLLAYLLHATPAGLHHTASVLLPAAITVVILTSAANVFSNALDGCQRMDLRCVFQAIGSFAQAALTWYILPRLGADGLGLAQIAQAVILLAGCAITSFVIIGAPLRFYLAFDSPRLRAMFSYGGNLQLIGVAQMLFEPLVKVLLTSFGGIALTGYFDMANKIIVQFRSVIVAAYGALVPHVAARAQNGAFDIAAIRAIYRQSVGLLLFLLTPYFAIIAAGMPLVLTLWRGHFDAVFLAVALIMLIGWFVNSLFIPAYMIFVATGKLRWNLMAHVAIGGLVLCFGPVAGHLFGGKAILVVASAGLILGLPIVLVPFRRDFDFPWHEYHLARRLPSLLLFVAAYAGAARIAQYPARPSLTVLVGLPVAVGLIALVLAWFDPLRAGVLARIHSRLGRPTAAPAAGR